MSAAVSPAWQAANQAALQAELATLAGVLAQHAGLGPASSDDDSPDIARIRAASRAANQDVAPEAVASGAVPGGQPIIPAGAPPRAADQDRRSEPSALDRLCQIFQLSAFERRIVLLCAGVELDGDFARLCAGAHDDPACAYPTLGLALAALPEPHWWALAPAAPLRRWGLIEVAPGRSLAGSPLRLDERVLFYLLGIPGLDAQLAGQIRPLGTVRTLAPSEQRLAATLARAWHGASTEPWPVLQLCGPRPVCMQACAAAACRELGLDLYAMPGAALPPQGAELEHLARLWEREAALSGAAMLLDCQATDRADRATEAALAQWVETLHAPLLLLSADRRGPWSRPALTFSAEPAPAGERRELWAAALGDELSHLNGKLDRLVAQFDLEPDALAAAWAAAQAGLDATPATSAGASPPSPFGNLAGKAGDNAWLALWDACRAQARPQLDDLAQRLEPAANWDDLVLPDAQLTVLREVAMHVRQRSLVYDTWGFAGKGGRGLGISALFAGLSGTGKTMAAEVLARELRLDLYRIDLSAVVSKYIGETEKNLRRVFDAAEGGAAILLFDEADALFGKRSQVKDSHDRYANIEVGYLLQRMEAYRGLAILTTNQKEAIDDAFLRRIRFVIQFPFPDPALRARIWQRIFPAETPVAGLDHARLARLNVAGGNIRNIALHAAFLAADAGAPAVGMAHLLQAARREYEKLERVLTDAEIRDWPV
jgi:hypothetical protein